MSMKRTERSKELQNHAYNYKRLLLFCNGKKTSSFYTKEIKAQKEETNYQKM